MLFDVEQDPGLMGDLYTPQDKQAAMRQALMAFGSNALANSGWSSTPVSLGQAIGPAISQGMTAYESGLQQAVKNALLKRQIAKQDKADAIKEEDRQRAIARQQQEDELQRQERERLRRAREAAAGAVPEKYRESFIEDPDTARSAYGFTPDGSGSSLTSNQKDFQEYQRLKEIDPEAAEKFGRQAGILSREGQDLSAHMEKRLTEANDEAVKSASAANNYLGLAQEFENQNASGGIFGRWAEGLKDLTGSEEAVSKMRQEYRQIRNTEAVKNLPPGVASDKDIELALSGFPSDTANSQYIASFMRGMAKLAKHRADYNEYKAQYISERGTERGFLDAWRAMSGQQPDAEAGNQPSAQPANQNTVNWSDL